MFLSLITLFINYNKKCKFIKKKEIDIKVERFKCNRKIWKE